MDCGYCTRVDCTHGMTCPFDRLKTNFQKFREAYEGADLLLKKKTETETIDVDVSIKEV